MSYQVYWAIALDPADTGLTLEVQPLEPSGTAQGQGPAITQGFTEQGNGMYTWIAQVPTNSYYLRLQEAGGGTVKALRAFYPVELLTVNLANGTVSVGEVDGPIFGDLYGRVLGNTNYGDPFVGPGVRLDPVDPAWPTIGTTIFSVLSGALTAVGSIGALLVSKLNLLTSTAHVVLQATTNQQNLTFYQGSDYTNADGGAPSWSGVWSPAELASIAIQLHNTTLGTGTITGATGTQSGVVEVTAADLEMLQPGDHDWQLVVTTVDNEVLPPVYRGKLTIKAEP